MMMETPLDIVHDRMQTAPEDENARLAFYEVLAVAELFVLLDGEPRGDDISPSTIEHEGVRYVLVFDTEDRLLRFTERATEHAAMAGRRLAQLLAGEGAGLALNLDVAPSAILIPPEAMAWLAETAGHMPRPIEARPVRLDTPVALPESLVAALDHRLRQAAGRASAALLCSVSYDDGQQGHLLAFTGASRAAQDGLARLVAEAVALSGLEQGTLDVLFLDPADPVAARMARVSLRFDLRAPPEPPEPDPAAPPGSDPDRPPVLR